MVVMEAELGETELCGQVTFRRPLSKRLVFFDLKLSANGEGRLCWVELLVKAGEQLSPQDVRNIRNAVKLGDAVRVVGRYEYTGGSGDGGSGDAAAIRTFIVRRLVVVICWRALHSAMPFVPQPAPHRHDVAHLGPEAANAGGGGGHVAALGTGGGGGGGTAAAATAVSDNCRTGHKVQPNSNKDGPGADGAADGGGLGASTCIAAVGHGETRGSRGNDGGAGGGDCSRITTGPTAAATSAGVAVSEGDGDSRNGAVMLTAAVTAAAAAAANCQPVCKYWAATGRCPKGGIAGAGGAGACRYDHPPQRGGAAGVQQLYVKSRRAQRLAAAADLGFVHGVADAAKRRRAAVFCDWLVQTYGRDFLNSGTGVLDVAGGRGALTFHLLLHHGVTTTLVEPRPAKLSRRQHREIQQAEAEAETAAEAATERGGLTLPQLRRRFEPRLWRYRRRQAHQAASGPSGCDVSVTVASTDGDGDGDDDDAGLVELLMNCSMVVGLHPDQATEAILDFALEYGKPFALVPCCVFPRLFPRRRLLPPLPQRLLLRQQPEAAAAAAAAAAVQGTGLEVDAAATSSSPSSTSARWAPVETYPQLLIYLLQRAQLYGRYGSAGGDGNESGECGSGGAPASGSDGGYGDTGGGSAGGGCSGFFSRWRLSQEIWTQLWRFSAVKQQRQQQQQQQQGQQHKGKSYSTEGAGQGPPELALDPGSNTDSDPDTTSEFDLEGLESDCAAAYMTDADPGDPRRTAVVATAAAQSLPLGIAQTLRWLQVQGAKWKADTACLDLDAALCDTFGSGQDAVERPCTASSTTTRTACMIISAANVRGSALEGRRLGKGALASGNTAVAAGAIGAVSVMAPAEPDWPDEGATAAPLLQHSRGKGQGEDWGLSSSTDAALGPPMPLGRGSGGGKVGLARLQFLGANQVVYRLPPFET